MKKIIAIFTFVLISAALLAISVSASETSFNIDSEYSSFFEDLPEGIDGRLPSNVNGNDPVHDAESLTTWDFLLGFIGSGVVSAFKQILPMFVKLLGLILISAVVSSFRNSLEPKTSKILAFCQCAAASVVLVTMHGDTLLLVSKHLTDLMALVNLMTPITVTLYAAGGNVASAGVSASAMTVFMNFCQNILAKTVIPFCGICLSLTTVSALTPSLGLGGFINLIKRYYTRTLTFMMSILCAILAAQSAIAAGSDSISLRAAKFVAGSTIPVIGGSVSESMRTLAASITLLRRAFGVTGIVLIALLTLPVIILLLVTKAIIGISASAAELLGCDNEKRLLNGISDIYGSLTAVVTAVSLMFVFMLTLLAVSGTALMN